MDCPLRKKTKEIPCHSIVSWLYLWSRNRTALLAACNNMRALYNNRRKKLSVFLEYNQIINDFRFLLLLMVISKYIAMYIYASQGVHGNSQLAICFVILFLWKGTQAADR